MSGVWASIDELELAVALERGGPDDIGVLSEIGISELVLVAAPPEDPAAAAEWVDALARPWRSAID